MANARLIYGLDDESLMAQVDGYGIPSSSVLVVYNLLQRKNKDVNLAEVLDSLVENQMVASYARKKLSQAQLFPTDRVGFPALVAMEDEFIGVLRSTFSDALGVYLKNTPKGSLESFVFAPFVLTKAQLKQEIHFQQLLSHQLNDEQREQAKALTLIQFKFPNEAVQSITLWDIYSRQNVQGRVAFHQYDIQAIKNALHKRIAAAFVLYWAEKYSGLNQQEISALRQFSQNKRIKGNYLKHIGLALDVHATSPRLKALAKQISFDEIKEYYGLHKKDFKQIEKVKARHIRLATQQEAKRVLESINKGLDFSVAARKYSIADDKNAILAGDLGWLERKNTQQSWLTSLALLQAKGVVSSAIRSPQIDGAKVHWEIILVDDVVEGYQNVQSKAVRYAASKALAKKKTLAGFIALKQQLKLTSEILLPRNLKPEKQL